MNGVSLLLALATLGVDARIENGANNIPTYTIRIENFVLAELNKGKEIATEVRPQDRTVRRFKILVTPEKAYQPRTAGEYLSRSDSLVEYEAVLSQDREIELWVQIAPDRLATLEAGKAIEGEVPIEATEIHRYVIFVGAGELPRQKAAGAGQVSPPAPVLTGGDFRLAPAGAEARPSFDASGRASAPPLRNNNQTVGQLTGNTTTNGARNPAIGATLGTRLNTTLRNPADTSVAPPLINYSGHPPNYGNSPPLIGPSPSSNYADDNRFGPATSYSQNQYAQLPNYNATAQATQTQWPSQSTNPNYAGMPPQQGQPNYAQRPDSQYPVQYVAQGTGAPVNYPNVQQPVMNAPAAAPVAAATAAATPSVVKANTEEEPKSSTPLILTTLALFTSLGVNTYLGWLAYSFFWRYRDAVNDSVRARSYNVPGRQAA